MSVENKLILKLLESRDWDVVVDKGITQNYFTGSNKRAFKWISNFKLNYGTLPDIDTFKKHFPEVNLLVDARECTAYYCDEVRKKIRQNKLVSVLEGAADKINAGNVESVYTDLTKLLMEVNTEFTFAEKVDIGRQTEERFKEYELNKITGGMTGIPLGILPIDKQTGGVKDMDLYTFLGKSGSGKSWMLCILAANLIKAGYKVMLLTKEMSPKQLLKRMDAIMACVSYNALKNGKLPANEEAQYKTYLEQYAPKYKDKLSIELVTNGVDEAISKIDNFQPDIALVDGGYLLSEGADPEDWKAVIGVWKAFKVFALSRKIPVILTSQLTDKNTVAYSTGLKQYCDGIWAMKQDDVQRAAKEIQIENIKIRDGEHLLPFTMSWDFSSSPMNYEVVHQAYNSETNKGFLVKDEPISLKKVE